MMSRLPLHEAADRGSETSLVGGFPPQVHQFWLPAATKLVPANSYSNRGPLPAMLKGTPNFVSPVASILLPMQRNWRGEIWAQRVVLSRTRKYWKPVAPHKTSSQMHLSITNCSESLSGSLCVGSVQPLSRIFFDVESCALGMLQF